MTEKKIDFKAVRILETLLQKQGKAMNHYSCIVKSRDTAEISPTRRPTLMKHRRTRNQFTLVRKGLERITVLSTWPIVFLLFFFGILMLKIAVMPEIQITCINLTFSTSEFYIFILKDDLCDIFGSIASPTRFRIQA